MDGALNSAFETSLPANAGAEPREWEGEPPSEPKRRTPFVNRYGSGGASPSHPGDKND